MGKKMSDNGNMNKFSIIIPYYNTPSGIFKKCIFSILNQRFTDFEVIVVDDGSDENYRDELVKICDNDKIKLFRKENGGVSSARNYGMSVSTGEYITFVDSDDEIMPDFLYEAFLILSRYNVKLLIGGLIGDGEDFLYTQFDYKRVEIYRGKEVNAFKKYIIDERMLLEEGGHINRGPVCRVVERNLATSCLFNANIKIGEDIIWNLSLLQKVDEIHVAKRVWYKYHYNQYSATHKYNKNIITFENDELNTLKNYVNFDNNDEYIAYNNHIFECLKRVYDCYLSNRWKRNPRKREEKRYLYSSLPWSNVADFRYFKTANKKQKIKAILYKMKMLFLVWDLKEIMVARK